MCACVQRACVRACVNLLVLLGNLLSTSAQYSMPGMTNTTRLMLLADVALGSVMVSGARVPFFS